MTSPIVSPNSGVAEIPDARLSEVKRPNFYNNILGNVEQIEELTQTPDMLIDDAFFEIFEHDIADLFSFYKTELVPRGDQRWTHLQELSDRLAKAKAAHVERVVQPLLRGENFNHASPLARYSLESPVDEAVTAAPVPAPETVVPREDEVPPVQREIPNDNPSLEEEPFVEQAPPVFVQPASTSDDDEATIEGSFSYFPP